MAMQTYRIGLTGLLLAGATGAYAQAVNENGVTMRAGAGLAYVDNVFATASGQSSDFIESETAGISVRENYSLQNLSLDASVTNNQYQTNSALNSLATNLSAGWQWGAETGWKGSLKGAQVVSQNSPAVSVNSTQSNMNTTSTNQALLGYGFSGGWELSTGLVNTSTNNQQAVYGQANSSQYTGTFVGAMYTFASGNVISAKNTFAHGTNVYDYNMSSTELNVTAGTNDVTKTTVNVTYWSQEYPSQSIYNFSGLMGQISVQWAYSEKTAFSAGLQHQLTSLPSSNSIYAVSDVASVGMTWAISSKLGFRGQAQKSIISVEGDPGGGASGEVDQFQTVQAGLVWMTRENWSNAFTYGQTVRQTNLNNSTVTVNQVSVLSTFVF